MSVLNKAGPELGRRIEMRRALAWLTLSLALALAACAAPPSGPAGSTAGESTSARSEASVRPIAAAPATAPPTATAPQPRTKPAPPMSDPLPPERVPDVKSTPVSPPASGRVPGTTGKVNTTCKTDADCSVKNVGNCCGYYPACVNVNSPTDPKGVQAQCAKSGMASVCGFQEISGCQCVKGQCTASTAGAVAQ